MKSRFRGYYPPSDDEMNNIWEEGLIVLDTNALLNILRYSASTRDQLLDLLDKQKEQIWIPYQVGLEFHRNRRKMPGELTSAFAGVQTALEEAEQSIGVALNALGRHAKQEAGDLGAAFDKHAKKLKKKLRRASRTHTVAVTSDEAQAATFTRISELYDGRVGEPYDEEKLQALFKEGATRYAKQIPPGYKDEAEKQDDRKYGDLVLWRQILDHATVHKKPLLFVTDDNKEDWWERPSGKTVGPRPELVEEYYAASGQRAHFYNLRRYLAFAKARGEAISSESVAEVKNASFRPSHASWANVGQMALMAENSERSRSLMRQIADLAPDLSANESYARLLKAMSAAYPASALDSRFADFLRNYDDKTLSSITRDLPRVADFVYGPSAEQLARQRAVLRAFDETIANSKGHSAAAEDDTDPEPEDLSEDADDE